MSLASGFKRNRRGRRMGRHHTPSAKELEIEEFLRQMQVKGARSTYVRSRTTAIDAPLEEAYRSVKGEPTINGAVFREWGPSCYGAKF